MIERIEAEALRVLLGVPEDDRRDLPTAILLPAEPDAEPSLTAELGRRWNDLGWGGLGTWFRTTSAPDAGFADRYPGLVERVVAQTTSATPRGLVARSEWAGLDPTSGELHHFVADVRQAGGVGSCLVVVPDDADVRAWYAPTLPVVYRALLSFERPPGVDVPASSREAALAFVRASAPAGFAALVPLDLHPWAGFVLLGGGALVAQLLDALEEPLPGLADVTVDEILSRAGRAAL